ncbi:MAG: FAD-dependent oxidoreductase [Acidobacteriota bacterium]|nr:FAD-dependent oxidoreductase [Blastocatellia bacterium]MDW8413314.1 FAD-dependent oxidoreductase [Acidobacteriota bacterium]
MGTKVAVIGAGLAGLVCASRLAEADFIVKVYEKARSSGGRMSTRRAEGFQFDHGAQYFTCRDERFANFVQQMLTLGIVAKWEARICSYEDGLLNELSDSVTRYVGVPSMSAVTRYLANNCNVAYDVKVERIEREADEWLLFDSQGQLLDSHPFLVIAIPAPQASSLLANLPQLAAKIAQAEMLPCWAVMLGFHKRLELHFDGLFINSTKLAWVARDSSKYGRSGETWVLHAESNWSNEHIDLEPAAVIAVLCEEFCKITGLEQLDAAYKAAHRWRYALPTRPLKELAIFCPNYGIGLCGDYFLGGRVEGAFLSGLDLAQRMINELS